MMIKPKSSGGEVKKLLPTLNLIDPSSLRSWLSMRRVGFDYGRKFFFRHRIFIVVNIIFMLILMTAAGAIIKFKPISMNSNMRNELNRLLLSIITDSVFFCTVSFHFVFLAGAINDEFQAHIGSIERNRLLVHSLFALRGFYFRDLGLASASKLQADSTTLSGGTSDSYIREKLAAELLSLLPSRGDEREV